jgi:hypothetical protein
MHPPYFISILMASSVITLLLLFSAAIATFAVDSSWRSDEEVRRLYKEWMAENNRSYNMLGEEESRFEIFKDNLRYIDEHNAAADRGQHTYWLGLTPFADLTNEEYRTTYLGLQIPDPATQMESNRYLPLVTDNLPSYVDWREQGAVAPIKNQGNCQSCWAFSAVSTTESISYIVYGDLITLSEQQLVDCDTRNSGCRPGYIHKAFEYIIRNGGIASDEDYPYKAKQGTCNNLNRKVGSIDKYEWVPRYNEQALKKAVANQPISVAVESAGRDFQLYKKGIFKGSCTTNLDHAVVIVGYGTESETDYWIVRNSWGTTWGEEGYIRMERNIASPQGLCGIAMQTLYPVKSTSSYLAMPEDGNKSII